MKAAYIDTSCLVAVAFGEGESAKLARKLRGYDVLISSNLLEAELRSAFSREGVEFSAELTAGISWVLPDRSLGDEVGRTLSVGHLRGADLWHVACALFVSPEPADIAFLTLDEKQKEIVGELGFATS